MKKPDIVKFAYRASAEAEMKLPFNAILIDSKSVKNSEFLSIIICRVDKSDDFKEFVTWVYNHEFEGCVSGNYFDNLLDAARDFKNRS